MDLKDKNKLKNLTKKKIARKETQLSIDKYLKIQNFISDKDLDKNDYLNILSSIINDSSKFIK